MPKSRSALSSSNSSRSLALSLSKFGEAEMVVVGSFAISVIQHEQLFVTIQLGAAVLQVDPQLLVNLLVEVFQQLLARACHGIVDLCVQLKLQLVKRGLDFFGGAAALVDTSDPLLEIHAGFDGPQHFITRAEDPFKEQELFREELKDALVGLVCLVEEIDHHPVALLPVAVTAANALFDALGVPREIVVHNEGAELEVDAF